MAKEDEKERLRQLQEKVKARTAALKERLAAATKKAEEPVVASIPGHSKLRIEDQEKDGDSVLIAGPGKRKNDLDNFREPVLGPGVTAKRLKVSPVTDGADKGAGGTREVVDQPGKEEENSVAELQNEEFFDPRFRMAQRRVRGRQQFRFVEPGSIVAEADEVRQRLKLEKLQGTVTSKGRQLLENDASLRQKVREGQLLPNVPCGDLYLVEYPSLGPKRMTQKSGQTARQDRSSPILEDREPVAYTPDGIPLHPMTAADIDSLAWYDSWILQEGSNGDVEVREAVLKDTRLDLIQHPPPIYLPGKEPKESKPPSTSRNDGTAMDTDDKNPGETVVTDNAIVEDGLPMYLTKAEKRKIRRQRRIAAEEEKQEQIRLGLAERPPDKVKLSNLARVLAATAGTQDPTKVEADIRRQVAERARKHEEQNEERKLTSQQRAEKYRRKYEREGQALAEGEVRVSVYVIRDLSNPRHRFKIEINAQQLGMTGVGLSIPGSNLNVVVVEGGPKQQDRYGKLMLRRIDWNETNPNQAQEQKKKRLQQQQQTSSANDSGAMDMSSLTAGRNRCMRVWQGQVLRRSFETFTLQTVKTEASVCELLVNKGLGHYWTAVLGNAVHNEE
eukprot:Clim_evm9s162 gene=Clim_evmTU9s162